MISIALIIIIIVILLGLVYLVDNRCSSTCNVEKYTTTVPIEQVKTCYANNQWTGQADVDTWCNLNCNHVPPYCPPAHCTCTDATSGTSTNEPTTFTPTPNCTWSPLNVPELVGAMCNNNDGTANWTAGSDSLPRCNEICNALPTCDSDTCGARCGNLSWGWDYPANSDEIISTLDNCTTSEPTTHASTNFTYLDCTWSPLHVPELVGAMCNNNGVANWKVSDDSLQRCNELCDASSLKCSYTADSGTTSTVSCGTLCGDLRREWTYPKDSATIISNLANCTTSN